MKAYPSYKDSNVEWVGKLPSHWGVMPLKYAALVNREALTEQVEDDFELQYIDIGNVNQLGIINPPAQMKFIDAPSRARRIIKKNDTIISTVRTYLKAVAFIESNDENLIASTGFATLTSSPKTHPKYLYYLVSNQGFVDTVSAYSTGVSYPAITSTELARITAWLPPLPEQQAIADFLDRKTAQIDTLIEKKQRQIDLLQEQRTALINHAVTKGLNPKVKMKDSGVEWLGEIPSGWEVAKLSYLTERIGDGLHGTPEYVDSSDYYFINGNNLVKGEVQFFESTKCVSEDEFKKYDVGLNDKTILLSINGTIGNVAFYRGEKVMLGKSAAFIVFQDDLLKNYFFHYLQSTQIQNYFGLESTGTTIFNLSLKSIRSTPLPLPPDDEKKAIADYLNKQQLEFDKATDIIVRQIAYLQEYRTALISEAVTGKVDVRGEKTVHE